MPSKLSERRCWQGMIARTTDPNHKSYKNYGGRGISVCERWRISFEAFLEDVGPRPTLKHSLDRHPNKDGDYAPGNVRWATATEQANNKRNNTLVTIDGVTHTIAEWSRLSGVSATCISQRLLRKSRRPILDPEVPKRRLTENERAAIIRDPRSTREIAKDYGVAFGWVGEIRRRAAQGRADAT